MSVKDPIYKIQIRDTGYAWQWRVLATPGFVDRGGKQESRVVATSDELEADDGIRDRSAWIALTGQSPMTRSRALEMAKRWVATEVAAGKRRTNWFTPEDEELSS